MATNKITPTVYTDDGNHALVELQADAKKDEITLKKNETFVIMGREIDQMSARINILAIILWVAIWYKLKLFREIEKNHVFLMIFVVFIANSFLQILSSSFYSGSVSHELTSLLNLEQMGAVLLGTITLFAIFSVSDMAKWNNKSQVSTIAFVSMLVGIVEVFYFSVKKTGYQYKKLRKLKESLFNIMIVLFSLCIVIILSG